MSTLILYTEVQSLSWFQSSSFRYFSQAGFALLKSISELPAKIDHTKNSRKMQTSDLEKSQLDEEWTTHLNHPETWKSFYEKNPHWTSQIKQLQDFWEQQKDFASCSNAFLLKSLEAILFALPHLQKARKEFERYRWRLPKDFAARYDKFLQESLNTLLQKRQKVVSAMYARLKISALYGKLSSTKREHVDDVVFYMADQLSTMNIADNKSLKLSAPRTDLNEDYYLKFYNAVKRYGENDAQKHRVDMLHWSKNLGIKEFLLSPSTSAKSNKSQAGMMFVESGHKNPKNKDTQTKIVVPSFLKPFIPEKRRYPALYYWQEHRILDFWEKRQSFLYQLHNFYPENIDLNDETSLSKLSQYQDLIKTELLNIKNYSEDMPFLAFSVKAMMTKWKNLLVDLQLSATDQLNALKEKSHPTRLIKTLQRSVPIAVPAASKIRPLLQSGNCPGEIQAPTQRLEKFTKHNAIRNRFLAHSKIQAEQEKQKKQDEIVVSDNNHQCFSGHW